MRQVAAGSQAAAVQTLHLAGKPLELAWAVQDGKRKAAEVVQRAGLG
ncbi:MAG: hypothetical protein MUO38_11235 [Anaerolineales bacterium]|nr:hypothetical protein [Anaerolineales bacterium]